MFSPTILTSNTKDSCLSNCNTNPKYNPLVPNSNRGSVLPNPLLPLMARQPSMAQTSVQIAQDKANCVNSCDIVRDNRPNPSPELMTELTEQYSTGNPFQIVVTNDLKKP